MRTPDPAGPVPPPSWPMVRALGGVGVLCSLLIVTAYEATLPRIEANRAAALERAVFHVLPGAITRATFELGEDGRLRRRSAEARHPGLHAGYDRDGDVVGLAVEAEGRGFQDTIRLLYGYDPQRQLVIGMEVLESKETPGLGDKILKDADFLASFEALDVSLDEAGRLRHPIVTVKHGARENPWEIDGITGATISSKAVGEILRRSAEEVMPAVGGQLDRLVRAPTKGGGEDG